MENKKIDVNVPVTNHVLKGLLVEKNNIKDTSSQEYYDCINKIFEEIAINGHFLAVVKINRTQKNEDIGGKIIFNKGDSIGFELIEVNGENNKYIYLPLFTDWESLYIWKDKNDEPEGWILTFDDCCAWQGNGMQIDGIVINPYSDTLFITKEQISHIREEKELMTKGSTTIRDNEEVIIGDPINYPHALVNAVSNYAKSDKNINALYLKLMERKGVQSYLMLIDCNGDEAHICAEISKFSDLLPEGMYLDIIKYTSDSSLGKSIANDKPFYKKEDFLF